MNITIAPIFSDRSSRSPTRRQFACSLAAAALSTSNIAWAQAYPVKPIVIVVAYPAGGDTDALARLFAEKLQAWLGQPVLVDNRAGASGIIGSSLVSKAVPDGYILLLSPSTFSVAQLVLKTASGSGYDVLNGFAPVIQTGHQSLFLVANTLAGSPKTIKEVVSAGRADDQLAYASPGSGSPMHILGEAFNRATGSRIRHVPYKGVAPAVNDVLGGHVPLAFMTLGPVAPYVQTGKLAVLAVADRARSRLAPQIPTLVESGYDVEVAAWNGLWAPRGTPPDVVALLNRHCNEILRLPDVSARMIALGMEPSGGAPDGLARANARDYARLGDMVKELRIRAD